MIPLPFQSILRFIEDDEVCPIDQNELLLYRVLLSLTRDSKPLYGQSLL
jgi:hypothetical protein